MCTKKNVLFLLNTLFFKTFKIWYFTTNFNFTHYIGYLIINSNEQIITCHFCFETFEVDLGIDQTFSGHNTEIYEGEVSSLRVSDGNE